MLILPKLEVPTVPLQMIDKGIQVDELYSYLQTLVDYFYNCNAPIIDKDQPIVLSGYNTTTLAPLATIGWLDAVPTAIAGGITIGSNYTGGNITFNIRRRGAAAGTAVMAYTVTRLRDNAATATLVASTAINFTPGDVNTHLLSITLTTPSILPQDVVQFAVIRDGANVGDTMAATVVNDGITVSFI